MKKAKNDAVNVVVGNNVTTEEETPFEEGATSAGVEPDVGTPEDQDPVQVEGITQRMITVTLPLAAMDENGITVETGLRDQHNTQILAVLSNIYKPQG